MQAELRGLLLSVGVEHHAGLHRSGRDVAQPFDHGEGALPQGVGDLAVAGGDRRLHDATSSGGLRPARR
jgi:hypothetical protein